MKSALELVAACSLKLELDYEEEIWMLLFGESKQTSALFKVQSDMQVARS